MDNISAVNFMFAIIGLGLAAAGGGMTFLPQDHLIIGWGRHLRITLGWILIIWGFSISGYTTFILITGKSTQQAKLWFGGPAYVVSSNSHRSSNNTPKIKETVTPTSSSNSNQPTYCEAVSIWFNEPNQQPEFNIFPDNKNGETPQPKLQMKFYVDCFNKTDEERVLTFFPYVEGGNLPTTWKVLGVGIYQISGGVRAIEGPKFVVPPKTHFIFNALVEIGTEDMRQPAFCESFKTLSKKINFNLTVRTEEGEVCTVVQTVSIKDGFDINFRSNHQDITRNWGN